MNTLTSKGIFSVGAVKETFGPVEEFDVPDYLTVFQLLLNPCFRRDVPHCFSRWNQLFV